MKRDFVGGPAHGEQLDVRLDLDSTGVVCVRHPEPFRVERKPRPITPFYPRPALIHRYRTVYVNHMDYIMVHSSLTDEQGYNLWIGEKHEGLFGRPTVHRG